MRKILLASGSPRRKEILAKLGLPFEVQVSSYEEDMTHPLPPEELAVFLSAGKARAVAEAYPDAVVIAADSFVAHDGKVIGKPKSEAEAKATLQMLRGTDHRVITGVTIACGEIAQETSFYDNVSVIMRDISDDDIDAYIKTGEPMDKAGAYALQERGAIFIDRIEGDFFTAMGLPLRRLADELPKFGIKIW
jgi:septum formation protein